MTLVRDYADQEAVLQLNTLFFYTLKNLHYFCRRKMENIMDFLDCHINQIKDLCCKYNVRRLSAFGSVLIGRFNEQSDVDFDKNAVKDYFINYFDFKYVLENILDRQVDLLEEQPIRNSYLKKSIESIKTFYETVCQINN